MTSGVYQILNTVNGKPYVGSSANIERRWSVHRHALSKGTHHSVKLSRAYAKHGADAFAFSVLETCEPELNIARELYWITLKDAIVAG